MIDTFLSFGVPKTYTTWLDQHSSTSYQVIVSDVKKTEEKVLCCYYAYVDVYLVSILCQHSQAL